MKLPLTKSTVPGFGSIDASTEEHRALHAALCSAAKKAHRLHMEAMQSKRESQDKSVALRLPRARASAFFTM